MSNLTEQKNAPAKTGGFHKKARLIKRAIGFVLLAIIAYQGWLFTHILYWKYVNPSETSFMSMRLSQLREKDPSAKLDYQWVPYEKISDNLKRAVIAAEDGKFLDHDGFDWEGIQVAMKKNEKSGKAIAGGSTITQQLAKNLLLSPRRSYLRKAEEAVITVMIETLWSKQRILEVYLNVAEWGNGLFGAQAAAQRYYKIPASKLSAEQSAHLAVMLPNPVKYEKRFPSSLIRKSDRIKGWMRGSEIPD